MLKTDDLIRELTKNLTPVKAITLPQRATAIWGLISVAATIAAVAIFFDPTPIGSLGTKNLSALEQNEGVSGTMWSIFVSFLFITASIVSVYGLMKERTPGECAKKLKKIGALTLLASFIFTSIALVQSQPPHITAVNQSDHAESLDTVDISTTRPSPEKMSALKCFIIFVVTAASLIPMIFLLNKGVTYDPIKLFSQAGLYAAPAGIVTAHWLCADQSVFSQLLTMIVIVVATVLAGYSYGSSKQTLV